MAVLMVHEAPGADEQLYEKVVARFTDGKGLNAPADWGVAGLLSHTAGPTEDGWRVIDVWESADAFERFGAVMVPILQEIGFPGEPKLYPVHNFVK